MKANKNDGTGAKLLEVYSGGEGDADDDGMTTNERIVYLRMRDVPGEDLAYTYGLSEVFKPMPKQGTRGIKSMLP